MRYVLIPDTGELMVTGGDETAYLTDLGTTTPQRVPLAPLDDLPPITGWVNPSASTANPSAGQTLINLGAAEGDYHGPVVITRWDDVNEEAVGLQSDQAYLIEQAYADAA